MIIDDTLQIYKEEAEAHLADIEKGLLIIEHQGLDESVVQKIFRATHSIKGGASFIGLEKIKQLAHKLENVLGLIRDQKLVPNPEIVNCLLMGFDKLQELMTHITACNDIDIDELIVLLTGLTTAVLPEEEKKTILWKRDFRLPNGNLIFTICQFDVDQAKKSGKYFYILEYDLIFDVQDKNLSPLDIFNYLKNSGIIIDTKVDVQSVGTLDDDFSNSIPVYVLYVTDVTPQTIESHLNLRSNHIYIVPEDPKKLPVAVDKYNNEQDIQEDSYQSLYDKFVGESNECSSSLYWRIETRQLEKLTTLINQLSMSQNQLSECILQVDNHEVKSAAQKINDITSQLYETIQLSRLQPLGKLFNKFNRLLRCLSLQCNKQILYNNEGSRIAIDKKVLDGLSEPMTQLLRKCIDSQQRDNQKNLQSSSDKILLYLQAYYDSGKVMINVVCEPPNKEDTSRTHISHDQYLVDMNHIQSIFTSLNCSVFQVEQTSSTHSIIKISIPTPITLISTLLVTSKNENYLIPIDNLADVLHIQLNKLSEWSEESGITHIFRIEDISMNLTLDEINQYYPGQSNLQIVVVFTGKKRFGLIVDDIHDSMDMVITPLAQSAMSDKRFGGVAYLENGNKSLLLHINNIAKQVHS